MNITQSRKSISTKDYLFACAFAVLYPLLSYFAIGFHHENILMVMVVVTIYLGSPSKRKLTGALSVFGLLALFIYLLIRIAENFPQ